MKPIIPQENETYNEYINRILSMRINEKDTGNYQELHHIIPRCMNGSDDESNLIYLYAIEHYYAHKLLAYENEDNYKLQTAYWAMSGLLSTTHQRDYELTPEELADARERMGKSKIGLPKSPETIKRISENHADISGDKNPMYGKHHTAEVCEKLRQINTGKKLSQDTKDKISKTLTGRVLSEETRKKISKNNAHLKGANHPQSKKIQCIETGDVFDCSREAGLWAGLSGKNPGTSITKQILHTDKCKYAGHHPITNEPLTWQYYIE